MQNIKLTIAYDGTRYKGWQKQTNTENTIQGKLNQIISELCGEPVDIIGAGRTDNGVHAYRQVAHFQTNASLTPEMLKRSVNEKLDHDICVTEAQAVSPRFHARYNAIGKLYRYRIWNHEYVNVFERKYAYHLTGSLDRERMRAAASRFLGTHDFKGFSSDKRTKKSTVKTLHAVEITVNNGMTEILMHGNSFLYHMARIITGTLIEIGLGLKPAHAVEEVFKTRDRTKAGFTAPPQGLFLQDVLYE